MPHIHTEPGQHDTTGSAYIFRVDDDTPKMLLHMHKKLGKWLQFGGHVELNETPWQAISHEIVEETGYDLSQLRLLQPQLRLKSLTHTDLHPYPVVVNTQPFSDEHFHSDLGWAFVTDKEPAGEPDEGESSQLRLFSREELALNQNEEVMKDVVEIGLFIFDEVLGSWEEVPYPEPK